MAIPITVPRLGWNMEEGIFVDWLKPDGAAVRAGEALYRLESDKATEDVECLDEGLLRIPPDAPRSGDRVAVGAVIGYLVNVGEDIPISDLQSSSTALPADMPVTDTSSAPEPRLPGEPRPAGSAPASSPRARRLAGELGVDWRNLQGSGRTGRIRERDVRAEAARLDGAAPTVFSPGAEVALTPLRKAIAEHMLASHRSTAPVTLTTTVDATALVHMRDQFRNASPAGTEIVPSYTDLIVKLTAHALQKHPLLNARWHEGRIVVPGEIHVGIAVDTPAGLVVPVLRDVPSLGLKDLAAQSRDLVERGRQRRLTPEEMRGGTFTVTNLGAFGIDAFTPLLHLPQCAILGVGRIQRRPAVVGEQIVAREQVTLSLTFDHRVVDGAPAARFLQTLGALIEGPRPWLIP